MKPGYKTTEFWLSLLAMILGALFASGAVSDGSQLDKILGLAASILGQLGYVVPRGMAKAAESRALGPVSGGTSYALKDESSRAVLP